MTTNQKILLGTLVAVAVLLTGTYALRATERNRTSYDLTDLTVGDTTPAVEETTATVVPDLDLKGTVRVNGAPQTAAPTRTTTTPRTATSLATIPAGTTVEAKVATHINSRDAAVGDRVTAVTTENIVVNGRVVVPAGTTIFGRVAEVKPASETRSAAVLRIEFNAIGENHAHLAMISPDLTARARAANRAVDAGWVIGGAATGAVIGNQTEAEHGTEIGAVVGGALGGVAATNIGANVQLVAGEIITIRFTEGLRL